MGSWEQLDVTFLVPTDRWGRPRRGWRRAAAKGKNGDFGRLWEQCAGNIGSHFVRATPRKVRGISASVFLGDKLEAAKGEKMETSTHGLGNKDPGKNPSDIYAYFI